MAGKELRLSKILRKDGNDNIHGNDGGKSPVVFKKKTKQKNREGKSPAVRCYSGPSSALVFSLTASAPHSWTIQRPTGLCNMN